MHICRFQFLHLTATEATRVAVWDFVNPKQALCVYASQVYSSRCASKMQMGMAVRCCSSGAPAAQVQFRWDHNGSRVAWLLTGENLDA